MTKRARMVKNKRSRMHQKSLSADSNGAERRNQLFVFPPEFRANLSVNDGAAGITGDDFKRGA